MILRLPPPSPAHRPTTAPRWIASLCLALGILTASASNDAHLVKYRGDVAGAVVADLDLQNPSASAALRSTPFGRGTQEFEDLTLVVSADGPYTVLDTGGIAVSTYADGSALRIQFALHGIFTGPTTVVYTGLFTVIPGGTGRFACPDPDLPLGEGSITGSADVLPDLASGTITFAFHHQFDGSLLIGKGQARKGGNCGR